MKTACVLLLVLVGVAFSSSMSHEKRFVKDTVYAIAQQIFNSLVGGAQDTFTKTVEVLKDHINSGETQDQCVEKCLALNAKFLHIADEHIKSACGPLCTGVRFKLGDIIG